MSRYINADALIEKFKAEHDWSSVYIVEDMPTADVRPIVKGEWIKESDNCVMGDGYMWFCSICGDRVYFDTNGKHDNYCRTCGSDMRGDTNEQIH